MAVDWKGVEKFTLAHWPYFLIGFVVLVGLFYTLSSGSSSSSGTATATPTTSTLDPNAAYAEQVAGAVQQDQVAGQLEAAQIAGQVQTVTANDQALADINQTNASASSAAYIATTQAEANTAQYALAAASGQNIQALQSLAQGFSAYTGGLAEQTAADATAAAGVASSNDQTAAQTLQAALGGAANLSNVLTQAGLFGSLSNSTKSGYLLLPNITSPTNLLTVGSGASNAGYVDNGTFDLAA